MAPLARIWTGEPLSTASEVELPADAVRHLQVRRLQPGDRLRLFDGRGCEWEAQLLQMGRHTARVHVGAAVPAVPELPVAVTLAFGVPANDRVDRLVEKATELGAAALQPLLTERSLLRLHGERAARRREHWQAIAVAASEQCGRAVVPPVGAIVPLAHWLAGLPARDAARWILLPGAGPRPVPSLAAALRRRTRARLLALSGPEGGFAEAEVEAAAAAGFVAAGLGPRVLRADTAPLALMAWISLLG